MKNRLFPYPAHPSFPTSDVIIRCGHRMVLGALLVLGGCVIDPAPYPPPPPVAPAAYGCCYSYYEYPPYYYGYRGPSVGFVYGGGWHGGGPWGGGRWH